MTARFNPRPARRPGATRAAATGSAAERRFNPRPARRPGATRCGSEPCCACIVSILAQPEGRAPHNYLEAVGVLEIVSILAQPEGRAPHGWGSGWPNSSKFQSSPSPKAGRHARDNVISLMQSEFQSSPSPKAGRHVVSVNSSFAVTVSILAQPEGRAPLRVTQAAWLHQTVSILAQPEGRAPHMALCLDHLPCRVSILAQPEGRAPPGHTHSGPWRQRVSILAQPEGRAPLKIMEPFVRQSRVSILAQPEGRAPPDRLLRCEPTSVFQSSPSPKAGRHCATT